MVHISESQPPVDPTRKAWDALPESWPSGTADPDEEQLPKTRAALVGHWLRIQGISVVLVHFNRRKITDYGIDTIGVVWDFW